MKGSRFESVKPTKKRLKKRRRGIIKKMVPSRLSDRSNFDVKSDPRGILFSFFSTNLIHGFVFIFDFGVLM